MRDYSKGAYRIKETRKIWAERIQASGKDPSKLRVQSGGSFHFIVYDGRLLGRYYYHKDRFIPAK